MYVEGQKKGTIRFSICPNSNARQVAVAGSFSKWQPLPMKKQKDGSYVCEAPCATETFEYKFIVDGNWMTDPDLNRRAISPIGTVNSVGQCYVSSSDGSTRAASHGVLWEQTARKR